MLGSICLPAKHVTIGADLAHLLTWTNTYCPFPPTTTTTTTHNMPHCQPPTPPPFALTLQTSKNALVRAGWLFPFLGGWAGGGVGGGQPACTSTMVFYLQNCCTRSICWTVRHVPPSDEIGQGTELNMPHKTTTKNLPPPKKKEVNNPHRGCCIQ